MIVLHAGLVGGRFLAWGEAAPEGPFADPAALRDAVPGGGASAKVVAWLPGVKKRPVPSTPILGESPDGPTEVKPWRVAALEPGDAIELLAAVTGPTLAPGVAVGATLAYWAAAARFAAAIVAKEAFLPDVANGYDGWVARWTPALAGTDATRAARLAAAMPPACRALSERHDAPPSRAAADVLRDFLAFAVDALVRRSLPPRPRRRRYDSLHDQWLDALRSPDGAMTGDDGEMARFAGQIRDWRRPVTAGADAPFRLGFRLEEPTPKVESWYVRYLLQARDDPSLLVPAADVWKGRGAKVLGRGGFEPKPFLLAGLGQAAALNADIEASLTQATPAGFAADATTAHRFLTESAWLLEQAGFGVLLPAWWTGQATKLKLTASAHVKSPPMVGGSGLTLEDLVQFEWRVAVGDAEMTLAELQALAKLKAPLVRVRGQWVQVSAEEIQAAIDLLKRKAEPATLRDVVKLAVGATPEAGGLPTRGVTADGWVEQFLEQLTADRYAELPPPAGLTATLRPYQLRGYSWLAFLRRWGLGACLADDMGLGKTVQTLALLQRARDDGERKPALLVCPTSVIGNWLKEAARFTPDLAVVAHHGPGRPKTKAAFAKEITKAGLVVTSYGTLLRDKALFEPAKWSAAILDEAQNVKNPNAKQSQAARALTADFRVALTGTPVENHVGDLWALGQFLKPGFLGSQTAFRQTFFVPIQLHRNADATARLKKLTAPFLLRRVKTDPTVIADLPPKIESTAYCQLTKEQASLYEAVVQELADELQSADGIRRKGLVLAALSKLKQVCNHPRQFLGDNSPIPGRSGKLARLTEMLEEVFAEGDKTLVFTQFTEMGDILKAHLQATFGREVLFLHGGTTRKARDRMVTRFQTEKDGPAVFLLSLKAGGTGLNLTAATHVFHFDRWWNPAVETQATDRAFRIGQTRTVQVHKFVCSGTLEEKIDEMIERKRDVAARVVGTGEAWLTELDDGQLRDLLALRPGATEE
ncbi:MAG: DEAD/DEAH box helicase [Gemmataceae bacterium]